MNKNCWTTSKTDWAAAYKFSKLTSEKLQSKLKQVPPETF
jgi:hypothetical protein